jgi:hypothetical protein
MPEHGRVASTPRTNRAGSGAPGPARRGILAHRAVSHHLCRVRTGLTRGPGRNTVLFSHDDRVPLRSALRPRLLLSPIAQGHRCGRGTQQLAQNTPDDPQALRASLEGLFHSGPFGEARGGAPGKRPSEDRASKEADPCGGRPPFFFPVRIHPSRAPALEASWLGAIIPNAPVAQSDRALGFEPRGTVFESRRARQ